MIMEVESFWKTLAPPPPVARPYLIWRSYVSTIPSYLCFVLHDGSAGRSVTLRFYRERGGPTQEAWDDLLYRFLSSFRREIADTDELTGEQIMIHQLPPSEDQPVRMEFNTLASVAAALGYE